MLIDLLICRPDGHARHALSMTVLDLVNSSSPRGASIRTTSPSRNSPWSTRMASGSSTRR